MRSEFMKYAMQIDSLTVFAALRCDPVIGRLRQLLGALALPKAGEAAEGFPAAGTAALVPLYSDLLAALYPQGADLSEYIRRLVLSDDNFYVQAVAAGRPLPEAIQEAARRELNLLQDLAALDCRQIRAAIDYDGYLPMWTTSKTYLISDFMARLEKLPATGFGIFAQYIFFRIADEPAGVSRYQGFGYPRAVSDPNAAPYSGAAAPICTARPTGMFTGHGQIVPVPHPDVQPLEGLYGYAREKQLILRNTEALVEGAGASNMLLYGDAGTGKSSTIKAAAAAYADRGLRLIEVRKNQLYQIPEIVAQLAENPLKFILFIDDLSFAGNDDNFSALKATLEGSVAGRTGNTVIYATSNRRHLVKETFSDRAGDELHENDTIQETMSLAARFGLTITFSKPEKDDYLDIVRSLATEYGIQVPDEELVRRAEAHAIRRGGRSPRTAKQFVELLKIGL